MGGRAPSYGHLVDGLGRRFRPYCRRMHSGAVEVDREGEVGDGGIAESWRWVSARYGGRESRVVAGRV